jgi:hypothetical protein
MGKPPLVYCGASQLRHFWIFLRNLLCFRKSKNRFGISEKKLDFKHYNMFATSSPPDDLKSLFNSITNDEKNIKFTLFTNKNIAFINTIILHYFAKRFNNKIYYYIFIFHAC